MEKVVYSVEEMAKALGISRVNAYELCKRNDFPAVRITPRRIVIPVDRLKVWLDKGGAL